MRKICFGMSETNVHAQGRGSYPKIAPHPLCMSLLMGEGFGSGLYRNAMFPIQDQITIVHLVSSLLLVCFSSPDCLPARMICT